MSRLTLWTLVLISALGGACAYRKVSYRGAAPVSNEAEAGKGLDLQMIWIKNKKETVELKFRLQNNYDHGITIPMESLTFNLMDRKAKPRAGVGTILIGAHGADDATVAFDFPRGPREGAATFVIDPIREGSYDKTDGKILPPFTIPFQFPLK